MEGANQQNTWNSPQTLIDPSNAGSLKLIWSTTLPQISGTPVIVNGIVYVSGGTFYPGYIYALNESTGNVIWEDGPKNQTGLGFSTTAGVTVDSGLVFGGTFSNQLVALNATTGLVVWQVPIDQGIVENPQGTYIGPEATPLVFDHKVIIGNIEGNSAARGFVRAFSESNGSLLWTFYTVPASPMTQAEPGYNNSWGNCNYCGGGDLWSVPALDQRSGVIYFGTGDASPSFNASQRAPSKGDVNLYTDCIIALNASDGKMIWYYQTIPADEHNWDPGMPVQLFNTMISGVSTSVVGEGSKSGYYYELYATNGTLIHSTTLGIHLNDNSSPMPSGQITYPGTFGGVNTFSSFDPTTNMIYTMTYNWATNFTSGPITLNGQGGVDNPAQGQSINSTLYGIDASSGKIVWSLTLPYLGGGVSSTNDLVFTSDGQSNFFVFNATSGAKLWSYNNGRGSYNNELANWGPPSVADGMLFETSVANDGGVFAFRPESQALNISSSTFTDRTSSFTNTSSSTVSTLSMSSSSLFSSTESLPSTSLSRSSSSTASISNDSSFAYRELIAISLVVIVLAVASALVFRRRSSTTL
jgi:glucose dehydrogenase